MLPSTEPAVELFAILCRMYELDPMGDGVVLSHKEGHERGIATNHGDPEHLWNGLHMEYAGERYFYQKNLQGDITGLIDSTGNEVVTYTYDTWGKLLSKTDGFGNGLAEKNPFRYRGYYYDAEVSLYYVSSRYYDPETRRFVNADDVGIQKVDQGNLNQFNLYAYCLNNPVNRVDVEGNFSVPALLNGLGNVVTGLAAIGAGAAVVACRVATPVMLGIAAVTVVAGVLTTVNGVSDIGEEFNGKI